MDTRDIIRLVLKANKGKICGRTAMQKLVYLACKSDKKLELPNYTAHYYGPYSSEVGDALKGLVAHDFVKEIRSQDGDYITYEYELTDDGHEIVNDKISNEHKHEYENIKKIVETCKKYCDDKLDINELSYAAKIYHVLEGERGSNITLNEVMKKAKDYKWKINPKGATRGAKLLEVLGLVK